MTTLYECDWCGDRFSEREQVASVDVTIGSRNLKLHACGACVPEFVAKHFPDDRTPVG